MLLIEEIYCWVMAAVEERMSPIDVGEGELSGWRFMSIVWWERRGVVSDSHRAVLEQSGAGVC